MLPQKMPKHLEQRIFDLTLALYRVTDFFPTGEILRRHLREKANEVFSQALEYNYLESSESAVLKILGRIQSVKGYLEIARSLNIVKPINLFVLEREYSILDDFFHKELENLNKIDDNVSIIGVSPNLEQEQEKEFLNIKPNFSEEKAVLKEGVDMKEEQSGGRGIEIVADETNKSTGDAIRRQSSSFLLNERQGVILEHLKQVRQAKISDFYSVFNDMSSKTIQRDLQGLVAKNLLKKEGEKRWTTYVLDNGQFPVMSDSL